MNHPPRRPWLTMFSTGAVGVLALTACGGGDGEAEAQPVNEDGSCEELVQLDVSLGWILNVEWAGFWLADDRGYYEDECLDVNWIQGGPNAPSTMTTVSSGEAHIGVEPSMQNWLQAVVDGEEFTTIGSMFYDTPGAILSLAENPMESAEDLQGATIMGQDGTRPLLDAVFGVAGLEPDYEYIQAGWDADPLVEGDGDALTVYATNQPIMLEQTHGMSEDDYVVTTYADLGLPQYGCLIYAQDETLEDMDWAMEGFLSASVKGWLENEEDPEVAATLAVDEYGAELGLDLEEQVRENELQIPFVRGPLEDDQLLWVDSERWAGEIYDGVEESGVIDGELPAPEEILDMSYLEAAHED